jgi:hypothetical protein
MRCHLLPVLLLAACATTPTTAPADARPAEPPQAALASAESRMCGDWTWEVAFTSKSEGEHPADVSGGMVLGPGQLTRLTWSGQVEGMTSGRTIEHQACTDAAKGLLRMGVLHNLVMHHAGADLPEHPEKGWDAFVTVVDATWTGPGTMRYQLTYEGKKVATGTMTLDAATGLPTHRDLAVDTGDGKPFRVVETYVWTAKTPPPAP